MEDSHLDEPDSGWGQRDPKGSSIRYKGIIIPAWKPDQQIVAEMSADERAGFNNQKKEIPSWARVYRLGNVSHDNWNDETWNPPPNVILDEALMVVAMVLVSIGSRRGKLWPMNFDLNGEPKQGRLMNGPGVWVHLEVQRADGLWSNQLTTYLMRIGHHLFSGAERAEAGNTIKSAMNKEMRMKASSLAPSKWSHGTQSVVPSKAQAQDRMELWIKNDGADQEISWNNKNFTTNYPGYWFKQWQKSHQVPVLVRDSDNSDRRGSSGLAGRETRLRETESTRSILLENFISPRDVTATKTHPTNDKANLRRSSRHSNDASASAHAGNITPSQEQLTATMKKTSAFLPTSRGQVFNGRGDEEALPRISLPLTSTSRGMPIMSSGQHRTTSLPDDTGSATLASPSAIQDVVKDRSGRQLNPVSLQGFRQKYGHTPHMSGQELPAPHRYDTPSGSLSQRPILNLAGVTVPKRGSEGGEEPSKKRPRLEPRVTSNSDETVFRPSPDLESRFTHYEDNHPRGSDEDAQLDKTARGKVLDAALAPWTTREAGSASLVDVGQDEFIENHHYDTATLAVAFRRHSELEAQFQRSRQQIYRHFRSATNAVEHQPAQLYLQAAWESVTQLEGAGEPKTARFLARSVATRLQRPLVVSMTVAPGLMDLVNEIEAENAAAEAAESNSGQAQVLGDPLVSVEVHESSGEEDETRNL